MRHRRERVRQDPADDESWVALGVALDRREDRAEALAADARQALGQDTPVDRLRSLTLELQQVYQGLLAAAGSAQPPPQDQRAAQPGGEGDDVIDAEFTAHE